MVDQDLQNMQSTMSNYASVQLAIDERRTRDETELGAVLKEFDSLFAYIEKIGSADAQEKTFSVGNFARTETLVADASFKELEMMQVYRNIFLWRLTSSTKDKTLLYLLLRQYYSHFLNGLQQHSRNRILLEELFQLSLLNINTKSSSAFIEFINGPLAESLNIARSKLNRGQKNAGKEDWKDGAVA